MKAIPNVPIAMGDGVRLSAHVCLPDGEGPFPAVIDATPYRKGPVPAPNRMMIERGYALVTYDVRGTGDSEGTTTDPWSEQETDDGVEVVEWIARRDWCNGNVGMWGVSYVAMVALHVATRAPEHLKAIVVVGGPDDCYTDLMAPAGALRAYQYEQYAPLMAAYNFGPPHTESAGDRWAELWEARLAGNQPWSLNVLRHPLDGPYWRCRSVPPDYTRIRCPVYLVTGWADWYPTNYLRAFRNLRVPKRVLIGPWEHSWPNYAVAGPRVDGFAEFARWFDHWLKGHDTGMMDEPPAAIFVQSCKPPDAFCANGEGTWRSETEWPPSRVVSTPLYLHADGRLLPEAPNGDGERADAYTYDPAVGLAAGRHVSGMMPPWGQPTDQRLDEALSLVYTSDVLSQDLELVGDPQAVLHVSSSADVAAFYVKVCDVAPDGTSALVSTGGLNATQRESSVTPLPIEPERVYELRIGLTSIAYRFETGHRMRVMIASADFPNDWPTPTPAVNRVYRSGPYPSHVVLPQVPAQDPPLPEPKLVPIDAPGPTREQASPLMYRVTRDTVAGTTTVEYEVRCGNGPNHASFTTWSDDPARAVVRSSYHYTCPIPGGEIVMRSHATTWSDAACFHHVIDVEATVNGRTHFHRSWSASVPRALM